MDCNICQLNSLPKSPAKIVLDNGEEILICEECERLLSVIECKVSDLLSDTSLESQVDK